MTTDLPSLDQLARDICALAGRAGMPESFWPTDTRIARACAVLGITPGEAYIAFQPGAATVPALEPTPEPDPVPGGPAEVWTDGSASPNPGPGGWGWCTPDGRNGHGGSLDRESTNQRMEIVAAHQAILTVTERPLVVVSDSRYVVDGMTKKWWSGWLARGWTNSKGEPVANRDLWEPFIDDVIFGGVSATENPERRPVETGITFRWVKAHAGTLLNEEADRLANLGRTSTHGGQAAQPSSGRPQGHRRRR